MAGSVNKVILIGRLGRDPERRSFSNGGGVVSFGLATSETWRDRGSGDRKERTEWHNVVIFNDKLGEIAEKYLKKGSSVYLVGTIQSRKYEKDGVERTVTEIVLPKFGGELTLLDSKAEGAGGGSRGDDREASRAEPPRKSAEARAQAMAEADDVPW